MKLLMETALKSKKVWINAFAFIPYDKFPKDSINRYGDKIKIEHWIFLDDGEPDKVTTDDGSLHVRFYGVRHVIYFGVQGLPLKSMFIPYCKQILRAFKVTGYDENKLIGN